MAKNLFLLILGFYWAIMGLQSWAATDVLEGNTLFWNSSFELLLTVNGCLIVPIS